MGVEGETGRNQIMTQACKSRIPCSRNTRRLVKEQKRGGENYDSVLQKMVAQYDPDAAAQHVEDKEQ
jgi:hypothetical protein